MAWQRIMTTATRGHQALAAAEQAWAAVPMTRRVVRGRRRAPAARSWPIAAATAPRPITRLPG